MESIQLSVSGATMGGDQSWQGANLVAAGFTDTETDTTTSIYLVHMGPREGEPQLGGLVWFYNQDTASGVRIDGPHRTSAAQDLLYADLDLNIGFATLSTSAVLRMQSVQP